MIIDVLGKRNTRKVNVNVNKEVAKFICATMVDDPRSKILDQNTIGCTYTYETRRNDQPTKSEDVWCWWCCHPFDTNPLPMPMKYDEIRDVFTVRGFFCSWSCMKAYNYEHTGYRSGIVNGWIGMLRRRSSSEGTTAMSIKCAPPRQALRVFGGNLSIEEFRKTKQSYVILPSNMIHETPNLVVAQDPNKKTAKSVAAANNVAIDFDNVKAKTEPLRLKRTKPTANHKNTLEKTLGINFFISSTT